MPASGGSYGSTKVGDGVATRLKRSASKKVMDDQTTIKPYRGPAGGKFAGLPSGPSGGNMTKNR